MGTSTSRRRTFRFKQTALSPPTKETDREASGGPVWTGDMVDRWPGTWWTPVDGQLTPSISLFLVAGRGCGRCGKREAFSKSCGKVRSSFPQDVSFHSPVLC